MNRQGEHGLEMLSMGAVSLEGHRIFTTAATLPRGSTILLEFDSRLTEEPWDEKQTWVPWLVGGSFSQTSKDFGSCYQSSIPSLPSYFSHSQSHSALIPSPRAPAECGGLSSGHEAVLGAGLKGARMGE